MRVRLQKWGNSLAVRIPRSFALQTHVEQGSILEMSLNGDEILLRPVVDEESLDELLAAITSDNQHSEVLTGGPVGREEW